MKILLVGEFSGVHNQLMEQFLKDGHICDLVSDGDGWKGFTNTISVPKRKSIRKLGKILYPLLDFIGLAGLGHYWLSRKMFSELSSYDVIQFINPVSIKSFGAIGNLLLFRQLSKLSNNINLCALGGDFNVEKFYLSGKLKYSPWTGLNIKSLYFYYQNISFFFPMYVLLHFYVCKKIKRIIPGLYEYKQAYIKNRKCSEIIRLPINCAEYGDVKKEREGKVKIFYSKKPHMGDYYKKGYAYFDEAIKMLEQDNVPFDLVTANGIPFHEYKKLLLDCDVLLDQTLSYDRGMSGVIGMANGMITFTGNESDVEKFFQVKIPCVNAIPDSKEIYKKLKDIIINSEDYTSLKKESVKFVREYHSVEKIASDYIKVWTDS